ncbi:lysine-2,3-aminomutase-like protein [Arenibaculum pallidiluteum]|uniref:lysine-2,3-aminomutase-like protein n=1 Tax=Arenibaculum pallidiluteum TaxID=2812559 RepID=UPI001A969D62|nr:lysine-2,3-aminomutase-like protein [Arenibaculum pallidiluteum]
MDNARPARGLDALVAAGVLDSERAAGLGGVAERYAISVTPYLLDRIAAGSAALARQYIPDAAEAETAPEERADPIGDEAHSPVRGIVHRYPDRVLLKLLHACPVYCRFCFRREMVGPGGDALDGPALEAALAYIRERPEVWEVVLTGGDPLALSPRRLDAVLSALDGIAHLGVVRIHSRVPVADPARVTPELVSALRGRDKAVWLAVHANHPDELGPEPRSALARLADAGIPLLSQTVLLRGVNDDAATLEALFRALVRNRVKPYYLHHPDLAPGTGHFRVDLARGRDLVAGLRGRVSGLCQPTYVLDLPGGHGKVPAARPHLVPDGEGRFAAEDWQGRRHAYPPCGEPGNGSCGPVDEVLS